VFPDGLPQQYRPAPTVDSSQAGGVANYSPVLFANPSASAYATPEPSPESLKAWELELRQKAHDLRLQEFELNLKASARELLFDKATLSAERTDITTPHPFPTSTPSTSHSPQPTPPIISAQPTLCLTNLIHTTCQASYLPLSTSISDRPVVSFKFTQSCVDIDSQHPSPTCTPPAHPAPSLTLTQPTCSPPPALSLTTLIYNTCQAFYLPSSTTIPAHPTVFFTPSLPTCSSPPAIPLITLISNTHFTSVPALLTTPFKDSNQTTMHLHHSLHDGLLFFLDCDHSVCVSDVDNLLSDTALAITLLPPILPEPEPPPSVMTFDTFNDYQRSRDLDLEPG